jgi:hypothetical protein
VANHISEWFGQRIYPTVRLDEAQLGDQAQQTCPFLSRVLHKPTRCVKAANSAGVCSVSSTSNGSRQDWLVCPYRVIDSEIVRGSCKVMFSLEHDVMPLAVPLLKQEPERKKFEARVKRDGVGYVFFQDKLGGEISVLGSDRSPEMSFDVTVVEIRPAAQDGFEVARYGILEIQTMDYHGTYKHAVRNLQDGLRLHRRSFAAKLRENLDHWSGEEVEGPNIANVFKRTFYQTLLKFKLAAGGAAAAGTVLALPRSVWDSWQPFLGAPTIEDQSSGLKRFAQTANMVDDGRLNAYICVFDLDASSRVPISPVRVDHFIRVSPIQLAHHAFTSVPEHIINAIEADQSIVSRIDSRLGRFWPAFKVTGH